MSLELFRESHKSSSSQPRPTIQESRIIFNGYL